MAFLKLVQIAGEQSKANIGLAERDVANECATELSVGSAAAVGGIPFAFGSRATL